MCRNCYDKNKNHNNCCERRYLQNCCVNNRCDNFLWPMVLWMVRDMTRCYRCSFVDRYDKFRC